MSTSGCCVSPNWPTFLVSRGERTFLSLCTLLTDEPLLKHCADGNRALSPFTRFQKHILSFYEGRILTEEVFLHQVLCAQNWREKKRKNIVIWTFWIKIDICQTCKSQQCFTSPGGFRFHSGRYVFNIRVLYFYDLSVFKPQRKCLNP